MTLAQLMTLADRHRVASTPTAREEPAVPGTGAGMGLFGMAAMGGI